MTKRLTAAFAALLVSLAGLPLIAADPVSAHTQTVRRCAYDPFAGQQCWNEAVAHVHPPNNYSPPPDTRTRADQEAERKRQEAKRKAAEAERTRIAEEAARQQAERERLA
ncbi:MAG: hypothetical protein OXB99_14240, partial [Acidimicrobiaceae bacterium]|nr:hypothetical protein [Acidimicrobiaceae bacterium]